MRWEGYENDAPRGRHRPPEPRTLPTFRGRPAVAYQGRHRRVTS